MNYEQLRWLGRNANRPSVTLQIPPADRPHPNSGELSAFFRFEPGSEAALHQASTGHLRNDFSLNGEKAICPHGIAFQMLAGAWADPGRSSELILNTTEWHWPGGQGEP